MTDANNALLDRFPDHKELAEMNRREARIKLSNLIDKYNTIEKMAPQLPKLKSRLSEVEEACNEFKGLYRNLCLRDDVHLLAHNLKAEMASYIDQSMK